jgi:hypothetical protein
MSPTAATCLDECFCVCGDRKSVHSFVRTLGMFDADPARHGFGCPNKVRASFKMAHYCYNGCGNVVESSFPSAVCDACKVKVCEMECSRCIRGCLQGLEVRPGEEAHAHAIGCPCAEKKKAGGARAAQEENAQLKITVKNLESELKSQKSHHAETSLALELANRTNRTLRAEMDTIHSRIASVVMNELERIKKS